MTEAASRDNPPASAQAQTATAALSELLACDHRIFVRHAYRILLGREPDADGAESYNRRLFAGASRIRMLRELAPSPEGEAFGARFAASALDHTECGWAHLRDSRGSAFVAYAYQMLLGREPDDHGLRTYLTQLRGGAPPAEMLAYLVGSAEYQSRHRHRSRSGAVRRVEREVLRFRLSWLPLIGSLLRSVLKCEGDSLRLRRLRRIEFVIAEMRRHGPLVKSCLLQEL